MQRTLRRFMDKFDSLSKLGQSDYAYGRLSPSEVRSLGTTPIPVIPSKNGAGVTGVVFFPVRMVVWKPASPVAYSGTAGNFLLTDATGGTFFSASYTARMNSTAADVALWNSAGINGYPGPPLANAGRYDLKLSTGTLSGDGPPLYYVVFFVRYMIDPPLVMS